MQNNAAAAVELSAAVLVVETHCGERLNATAAAAAASASRACTRRISSMSLVSSVAVRLFLRIFSGYVIWSAREPVVEYGFCTRVPRHWLRYATLRYAVLVE